MTVATANPRQTGELPPPVGPLRRLAVALYRRPRAQLALLLAPPIAWIGVAYLGSLALFLITSFWSVDSFTGNVITEPTLDNYVAIFTTDVYRTIAVRT